MRKVSFYKKTVKENYLNKIKEIIESGNLTFGRETIAFENEMKKRFGFKHAIATSSGTSALHLAMHALGLNKGDKVVVPTNTFTATAMACHYVEAEVVFCDIELDNYCICPAALEQILKTQIIKAVVIVHLAGKSCDLKRILELKNKYNFKLIEDGAQAFYSKYDNEFIGKESELNIFSFYPTKVLGSIEGGLITTTNDEIAKKLMIAKSAGINRSFLDPDIGYEAPWLYDVVAMGFKYAMNNVCAALLLEELNELEEEYQKRKKLVMNYVADLSSVEEVKLSTYDFLNHNENFHLFIIRTPRRNELAKFLTDNGVDTSLHYRPLHLHSYWRDKSGRETLPQAESYYQQALSLPLYPDLTKEDQAYVIELIKRFFN